MFDLYTFLGWKLIAGGAILLVEIVTIVFLLTKEW